MSLNRSLNPQVSSVAEEGRCVFNTRPPSVCKTTETGAVSKEPVESSIHRGHRNLQEDSVSEDRILRSRIPASEKGKESSLFEGNQDAQAALSSTQPPPSSSMLKTAQTSNSDLSGTRLQQHQLGIVISKDGWEPIDDEGWESAKLHHRKRKDPHFKPASASTISPAGSAFFRSKMEGRCFNCLSPNHLAHRCRSSFRCWKCYRYGHRA